MTAYRFLSKTNKHGITTTLVVVVMLLLLFTASCGKENKEVITVTFDPEKSYTMKTTDVSTLISDSGITRYRIVTKEWLVFDKAKEPYSYFPEGIYLEKFDSTFNVEASVKADTAYQWNKKGLIKLVGNVEIKNLNGDQFETSLLYWDQKEERVYSDQFIKIIQADGQVITGVNGFESNQEMTKYKIFNSGATFLVNESAADSTKSNQPAVADSLKQPTGILPVNLPDTMKNETVKNN